jgi:hypothetical protein
VTLAGLGSEHALSLLTAYDDDATTTLYVHLRQGERALSKIEERTDARQQRGAERLARRLRTRA